MVAVLEGDGSGERTEEEGARRECTFLSSFPVPFSIGAIGKQELGCSALATGRRTALRTIVSRGQDVWPHT